jgi:hypothetical protein
MEISGGANAGKAFIDKKFSMFGNKPAAALQARRLSFRAYRILRMSAISCVLSMVPCSLIDVHRTVAKGRAKSEEETTTVTEMERRRRGSLGGEGRRICKGSNIVR